MQIAAPIRSVGFTGHRDMTTEQTELAANKLRKTIDMLISVGATDFYTGGALGFDTLAARAVLARKNSGAKIKLHLLLPFPGQEKSWSQNNKNAYTAIMEQADSREYFHEKYVPGVYHLRDRAIVENSEVIVAFLSKESGGTAYTVSLAQKLGRKIINLADI